MSKTGGSLESKKTARKKVVVEKTFAYPAGSGSAGFDFAVTSLQSKVSSTP
jgi:hypothetical protein